MKKTFLMFLTVCIIFTGLLHAGTVKNSKHNLSSGSPVGVIKSGDTSMVCIFCHTTHQGAASAPMWNREEGAPVYTLYGSSTLHSNPGQPDGTSKLCLSCHDGTIALGKVRSRKNEFAMLNANLGKIPPGRSTNLGSDLSDDHPISFDPSNAVNASPELRNPVVPDKVRYDHSGKIQCTTCHDPHNDDFGRFMVKSNRNSGMCKTCHRPAGYAGAAVHDTSAAVWNGRGRDPWPHTDFDTVTDNSCLNCHRSHGAGAKERLLTDREEDACLNCHDGGVGKNIGNLLNRTSAHRVKFYQGSHDPTENILTASRHVECVDCHNPHRADNSSASAPNVNGALQGVSGMTVNGGLIDNSQFQFQVCLKCHGQDKYRITTGINRQFDTANIRIAIDPANAGHHGIAAPGTAGYVPSLRPPYDASSRIYCTDCHNNNNAVNAGGSGPNGPHGSQYEFLLERRYEVMDHSPWSTARYALCFKCHNPNTLMDENVSTFPEHDTHVREENTSCAVCHDPHGSPNNVGLINFDTNAVFPNAGGQLRFEVIGDRGYCYLNCHGEDHSPEDYNRR